MCNRESEENFGGARSRCVRVRVSVGLGQERTVQVHRKKECRTRTCCVYVRYCGQRVGAIHPLSSSVARGQSPGRAQDVILVCGPTATHQPLEWSGRHEPAPSPKCTRRQNGILGQARALLSLATAGGATRGRWERGGGRVGGDT